MISSYNYDDFIEGRIYHTRFELTEELVSSFVGSIGLSYDKKLKVPSSIFLIFKPLIDAFEGWLESGTIHLKQETEHFFEPSVGDEFDVIVKIVDKYQKKDRNYLVFETSFELDKVIYCKQNSTYLMSYANQP